MPARAARPSPIATAGALFVFSLIGVLFALIASSPAHADQCDEERFQNVGRCSGGGGGGGTEVTSTPTPTPTPTPDPAVERAQAYAQARADVLAALEAPDFQIWPDATDNQVVKLATFFQVTDNWVTHSSTVTVGSQTVTVTAAPKKSHWTWAEAVGDNVPIICEGPGTAWQAGLTTTECGWTPAHSSSVVGDVDVSVRIEYLISSSAGPGGPAFTDESDIQTTCIAEVLTFGTNGGITPANTCEGGYTGGGGGGGGGGSTTPAPTSTTAPLPNVPENGGEDLPVSTQSCSGWIQIAGSLFGGKADAGGGVEYIVQEFADGSKIVTIAVDGGAAAGLGPAPLGGVVQVGDAVVGAYFDAGAEFLGTGGGGVEYYLPPGETVGDLIGELAVGLGASPVSGLGNAILPGKPFPTPPTPDTVFLDSTVGADVGATGLAGIGIIAATASAGAEAEVNTATKLNSDGTSSQIVTYSGQIGGDAGIGGGIPYLAWEGANVGVEARGSVSVETISDADGNEIQTIVTVSYGTDADAVGFGGEDDNISITTQEWTYDLTNPDVAAAIGSLDEWASLDPADIALNAQGPPLPSELQENGVSTGPVTQTLDETSVPFVVGGGIFIAGVQGSADITCYELS